MRARIADEEIAVPLKAVEQLPVNGRFLGLRPPQSSLTIPLGIQTNFSGSCRAFNKMLLRAGKNGHNIITVAAVIISALHHGYRGGRGPHAAHLHGAEGPQVVHLKISIAL